MTILRSISLTAISMSSSSDLKVQEGKFLSKAIASFLQRVGCLFSRVSEMISRALSL